MAILKLAVCKRSQKIVLLEIVNRVKVLYLYTEKHVRLNSVIFKILWFSTAIVNLFQFQWSQDLF